MIVPGAEPRQVVLEDWSFELAGPVQPDAPPRGRELDELLRELSREPFDLTADLMMRATLVVLAGEDHVLLLRMHHIAADAFSDSVLFARARRVLRGRRSAAAPPSLPELPIQYADFAVWQRERLQGELLDELRRLLDDARSRTRRELLRAPDRPAAPAGAAPRGRAPPSRARQKLADGLVALGREEGARSSWSCSPRSRHCSTASTGEDDVVIGSPIANRTTIELQGLIGFFCNTMALRTRLGGNPSFREVCDARAPPPWAPTSTRSCRSRRSSRPCAPRRDPAYNPLFQVNFRAQATERPALALTGLEVEPIAVDIGFSRFDLALELRARAGGARRVLRVRPRSVRHRLGRWASRRPADLLAQVVEDPDTPILALVLGSRMAAGRRSIDSTPPGALIGRSSGDRECGTLLQRTIQLRAVTP